MAEQNQMDNFPQLQEYPLEANFLNLIPLKAQKGFSTFDLEFTSLDADGIYIAIGSNVGVVYLYNRENGCMQKLKDNEHRNPVSCVKMLISLECLVAVGFRDGAVLVYKVPFQDSEELERFTVEGLHSCAITSLEWAKNGILFFSGDESGLVVCTEIDHLEHQSRSRKLIQENTKVVQLSYSHQNLVISTLLRSLIFSLKTNSSVQVGQKERKCYGPFGAIIYEDDKLSSIFASRPGQRLWKSDVSGTIEETMIFKNALMMSHPSIRTLTGTNENPCFIDFQFERLVKFDSYVLIWCDTYILLIDPSTKQIVGTSPKLDPVVDIAVSDKEIFILRGIRHVIRIASKPDVYGSVQVTEEPSVFEDILVPFKELGTFVKERSDSLSVTMDKSPTIFDWLMRKRSTSTPVNIPEDKDKTEETEISANPELLPSIVNLDAVDFVPVKIKELPTAVINITEEILTKDFKDNESDDIVFKVKKKPKKHKKVHFEIDSAPKREKHKNVKGHKDEETEDFTKHNSKTKSSKDIKNHINKELLKTTEKKESINGENENKTINNNFDSTQFDSNSEKSSAKTVDNASIDCVDNHPRSTIISNLDNVESSLNDIISPDSNEELSKNNNNPPILTVNINESEATENLDSGKSPDADDIYSSMLFVKPETEDTQSLESSQISLDSESQDDSSSSLEFKKEPPKYGGIWVEFKAPELLLGISVSNEHVFCIDVRNQLYFSILPTLGYLNWIELSQPAEKIAVSPSENVVWALYKGTIYAARQKAQFLWGNTEWISVAREVVSIAVDDTCGWYARSNGELVTQQELSAANPYSYPQTVLCKAPVVQVAVKNGVLWVLTVSGSLLAKKVQNQNLYKSKWREIALKNIPGIDSIFLGPQKTGWIVDCNGEIYFIIGVTPDTPSGTGEPWLVEASSYLFRPSTQLEQVMRRALNSETLTNLIRGKQHLCLSASDFGVWFCKTYDNLMFSNQKNVIGHSWELVIPPSTATATKWNLLSAEGINNSEGYLWCVNSTGELYCFDIKNCNLLPVDLPSSPGIRCLQPKYQSLWLLSADGAIYVRRGITKNCPQGMWWQALDLSQLETQEVAHISCSSFVSWACTSEGEVLMRLGSLNPSATKLNQAWISIGTANEEATSPLVKLSAIGKHFPLPLIPNHFSEDSFSKVYVGPLGYPVWAIDRRQNVYVREGATLNLPIGEKWASIPELHAKELCITKNAVWLLKSSGKIYRRFGVTEKNPCGDYWKQIPGQLDFLSATEDDDLWGLQNGSMFCHYSFILHNTMDESKKAPTRMISEDDWTDIMEDLDD